MSSQLCSYLQDVVQEYTSASCLCSSSKLLLSSLPVSTKYYGHLSFHYSAACLKNKFPVKVKDARSLTNFKTLHKPAFSPVNDLWISLPFLLADGWFGYILEWINLWLSWKLTFCKRKCALRNVTVPVPISKPRDIGAGSYTYCSILGEVKVWTKQTMMLSLRLITTPWFEFMTSQSTVFLKTENFWKKQSLWWTLNHMPEWLWSLFSIQKEEPFHFHECIFSTFVKNVNINYLKKYIWFELL